MARFTNFMTVWDLHDGILEEINSRAAQTKVKSKENPRWSTWRGGNFGFVYYDPSELDPDGDSWGVLDSKVLNNVAMKNGIRTMDLIMQNDPGTTDEDIAIDFEMVGAINVEIKNRKGEEPVFRVTQPAKLEEIIGKAAEWLAECEAEYEG